MVSPTPPDEFYFEIARAYQQAELEILGQIKNRLLQGQLLDELDWQTARLAEIQQVRKQAVSVLAKVNSSMTSKINGAFGAAYKGGEWAALKDAAGFLPEKPTAVSSAARQAAVRAAANAMTGGMAQTMPKLLRQLEDDYARVINDTVLRVQAGSGDRRTQTGRALEQLFGMGVKTGPGGKMNLPDYVTMAMRTGVAQTSIAGHMDTLGANGLDLVYIQPGPRHCDQCDEWSNKPLWRTTGPTGQQYTENLVDGKQYRVMVWGTLDQARAAGWGHPNCRCNVGAFIPGATVLPKPRPPWDKEGYEAQQKQRGIERKIREWKVRGALATSAADVAKANGKVALWQEAMRSLLKEHPALKRQARRESATGTYGPGMPWEGPVTPPKTPKAPKTPPKTPETPASLAQQVSDAQAAYAAAQKTVNEVVAKHMADLTTEAAKKEIKAAGDAATQAQLKLNQLKDKEIHEAQKAQQAVDADKSGVTWEDIDDYGLPGEYLKDAGLVPGKIEYYLTKVAMPKDKIWQAMDDYDLETVIAELKKHTSAIPESSYKAWVKDKNAPVEPQKAADVAPKPTPEAPEAPSATSKHRDPTPAPPGSWKGAEKPPAPKEPAVPKGSDVSGEMDAWLAKVKQKYEDFAKSTGNPKTKLEQSNNWSYVQKVVNDHDLHAADYLYQNKYLDSSLTDEVHKLIAKATQPDLKDAAKYKADMAKYGDELAQYKLNLAQWRTDNGITSEAKGLTGTRHSNAEGIAWAHRPDVPQVMNPSSAHSAANLYSGSAYGPWNARLRSEAPNGAPLKGGQYSKGTKDLDSAMGPIPEDVVLHRGTTFEEFGLGYMPPPSPQDMVGKTYTNHAYASTSVGEYAHFRSKPVQLEIMAPAGSKGTNLMRSSGFGTGEREFLLARGTQFFVHSVEEFSNGHGGKWRVRVEIVLEGEDPTLWTPIP